VVEESLNAAESGASRVGWSRRQVLRDPRFYVLLPNYLAASFVGTGFFFHQVHLVESKGWDLSWFAATFVAYAIGQVVAALATGILVDRYNALRMMQFELLPIIVSLIALATLNDPLIAIIFMFFIGMTSGATAVTHGAIWAEIYGVAHLGAIKALGSALMVLGSALSPPIMGWAIDAGVTMETIAIGCAIYSCVAIFLATFVYPRMKKS
jgi:predicted MFS family arabinose efflux permease